MSLPWPHCARCDHEVEEIHIEQRAGGAVRVTAWCHGAQTHIDLTPKEVRDGVCPAAFQHPGNPMWDKIKRGHKP